MPLMQGKEHVGRNIKEMRKGSRYRKIARKSGKGKAEQVAKAAALHAAMPMGMNMTMKRPTHTMSM